MLKLEKSQYSNSIFQLNYTKYEKKLWYKIVYYIKIYKFKSQYFFIRCIFFFLIKKKYYLNSKIQFFNNNMWNTKKNEVCKIVRFNKILYKFCLT